MGTFTVSGSSCFLIVLLITNSVGALRKYESLWQDQSIYFLCNPLTEDWSGWSFPFFNFHKFRI